MTNYNYLKFLLSDITKHDFKEDFEYEQDINKEKSNIIACLEKISKTRGYMYSLAESIRIGEGDSSIDEKSLIEMKLELKDLKKAKQGWKESILKSIHELDDLYKEMFAIGYLDENELNEKLNTDYNGVFKDCLKDKYEDTLCEYAVI